MEKKILVPCLDVIMIAFFAEKYTVKDHISNTKLAGGAGRGGAGGRAGVHVCMYVCM